jgi:hypothetical protein
LINVSEMKRIAVVIAVFAVAAASCTGSEQGSVYEDAFAAATDTTVAPTTTITVTTELSAPVADTVPSDWIMYTDEISGFSLSYPNDWEVFAVDEAAVAALLDSLGDAPLELANVARAFQAGLPTSNGDFDPQMNVVVEALPSGRTLDEFVAANARGFDILVSYESTESVRTVVAGREVVLVHGSFDLSEIDPTSTERLWAIQLYAIDGRTGWTVNCSLRNESAVEPDLEVCDAIVRTFEPSSS